MTPDAAPPPLVAAPPVPPVVPDSGALDLIERLENPTGDRCQARKLGSDRRCVQTSGHENGHDFLPDDDEGAGVVPDKPALAPAKCPTCGHQTEIHVRGGCVACNCELERDEITRPWANASVPAVTDDEAAKKVLALEFHRSFCGSGTGCRVVDPQGTRCAGLDSEDFRAANGVLSGLRSAGFLIVHHTKETRTMRPVVPLDHWGEPVKETP